MKRFTAFLGSLVFMLSFATTMPIPISGRPAPSTHLTAGKPVAIRALNNGPDAVSVTAAVASQQGSVYYVATDGDDLNPGTEIQPFRTIKRGISVLEPGDTLYVKSGTYTEEAIRTYPSGTSWDNPITIMAYPGSTVTLKPDSGSDVLRFIRCHYIIIDQFVLDGSNVDRNGIKITTEAHHIRIQNSEVMGAPRQGILITNDGPINSDYNQIINLDVHHNGTTDFDHGLYIATSHNLVDRSSIHNNAGWGAHIYKEGCDDCANNNIVSNNAIYDNARVGARGSGIILSSGNGNLAYNNLVWGNHRGIQVAYGVSDAKVYNNVVYANDGDGIYMYSSSTNAVVRNNIVFQNGGTAISDGGSGTIQDHNLVDTDPLFVDASALDFHLQPTSPAIDTGVALSEVPDDFDGVSRPRGDGYDIGAFEFPYSFRVNDLRVVAAVPGTSSLTVTLRWTAPFDALSYTLRSSNTPLNEVNWGEASIVTDLIPASPPGTIELLTTSVDYTGGTLYLALKSQNSDGAWSDLSNNAFWPHLDIYLPMIPGIRPFRPIPLRR